MTEKLGKLYERLWSKVGGKPWTEIIQEDQRKSPLIYLIIFLAIGILIAKLAGKNWWLILVGFLFGLLCGHFWW